MKIIILDNFRHKDVKLKVFRKTWKQPTKGTVWYSYCASIQKFFGSH